ncbi:MAG: hypothetical protein II122_01990, partial [Bacteroidaceae bacterium]|nr:hypothetical protein [Bacteroidaceae bacterium]
NKRDGTAKLERLRAPSDRDEHGPGTAHFVSPDIVQVQGANASSPRAPKKDANDGLALPVLLSLFHVKLPKISLDDGIFFPKSDAKVLQLHHTDQTFSRFFSKYFSGENANG